MASNKAWNKIFRDYNITNHDFASGPFELTADQIKKSCQEFTTTGDKEPRILCKQDTRSDSIRLVKSGRYKILTP